MFKKDEIDRGMAKVFAAALFTCGILLSQNCCGWFRHKKNYGYTIEDKLREHMRELNEEQRQQKFDKGKIKKVEKKIEEAETELANLLKKEKKSKRGNCRSIFSRINSKISTKVITPDELDAKVYKNPLSRFFRFVFNRRN